MSKNNGERLYKLRDSLEVEFPRPQILIFIDIEETYLHIVYDGKSICKIKTDGTGYKVTFTSEFGVNGHEFTQWLPGCRSISDSIRHVILEYKKGQKTMVSLLDLRDYLHQEIGDIATVICDRGTNPYFNHDRIIVKRDDHKVCSIYRNNDNNDLFDVIFYNPFIHNFESAGNATVDCLTVNDIPIVVKNRIDIYEGMNNYSADSRMERMLSQCKGGFTYANPVMKTGKISITVDSFIKDVIFNDPATIVFWNDGSKTVVKCQKGETFDPEKGLAMAISKKVLGNDYGYYETFAKYVGRYNKKHKEK